MPVAVLAVDPEGRVVHANLAAELLLNQSERSLRGVPVTAILLSPSGSETGRNLAAYDVDVAQPDAPRLRVDYLQTQLPDHAGWRLIALHARARQRRAGDGDRATGSRAGMGAAAMLAHEIKNPLSGIRGAAQLLGAGALTELIVAEVDRIAALIDRMQGLTDTRPPCLTALNIYPLLDHVQRVAKAGFARYVDIESSFDPSLPLVLADHGTLLQVMLNLVKNAAEAVAEASAPRIVLTTAYRLGYAINAEHGRVKRSLPIEIAVRDNGPGAPPEIADQIFDAFVSGKPAGQGLGLALVDKLIADMGGVVQYSREGKPVMTVFRLLLPRAP